MRVLPPSALALAMWALFGCNRDEVPTEPPCSTPDSVAVVLDFQAAWSTTDATQIAYSHIPHERGVTDTVEIWVKDLVTGDVSYVTYGEVPRWSPDGESLCFVRADASGGHVWIRDMRTGQEDRITSGKIGKGHPSWSGDGNSIAYATGIGTGEEPAGIWTIDVESRQRTHVAAGLFPDWSPVSPEIVFGPTPLRLIHLENFGIEVLVRRPTILFPRWSGDGRKIVYESNGTVRLFDRATGQDALLVDNAALPSWSPMADEVAFWRIVAGATVICAIGLDGSGYRQLTSPADYGITCLSPTMDGRLTIAALHHETPSDGASDRWSKHRLQ